MKKVLCRDCGRPCRADSDHPRCIDCYRAALPQTSKSYRPCSVCKKSCRAQSGVCRACCADGRGPAPKPRIRRKSRAKRKMPVRVKCPGCGCVTRTVSGVCTSCREVDESALVLTSGDWVRRPGGLRVWVADDEREAS